MLIKALRVEVLKSSSGSFFNHIVFQLSFLNIAVSNLLVLYIIYVKIDEIGLPGSTVLVRKEQYIFMLIQMF